MDYKDDTVEEFTKFEDVYPLFLNTIQDYSIKNLFKYNIDVALEMIEYFLLKSIPKFRNCEKDLSNPDTNCKNFGVKLDLEEKVILSDLMVVSWMDRVVNNITQMNAGLNDNDWRLCTVA